MDNSKYKHFELFHLGGYDFPLKRIHLLLENGWETIDASVSEILVGATDEVFNKYNLDNANKDTGYKLPF